MTLTLGMGSIYPITQMGPATKIAERRHRRCARPQTQDLDDRNTTRACLAWRAHHSTGIHERFSDQSPEFPLWVPEHLSLKKSNCPFGGSVCPAAPPKLVPALPRLQIIKSEIRNKNGTEFPVPFRSLRVPLSGVNL